VGSYAAKYGFVQLLRRESVSRDFASKVFAFRSSAEQIRDMDYEFIGNLDADVSFDPDYYEKILEKFREDPKLGISGGIILELIGKQFVPQKTSLSSVAGAVQLFRRRCYEDIGGYIPLGFGGIDSAAEIMARMQGWKVQMFPDFKVFHHRRVAAGKGNILAAKFRQGMTHYLLGYHPVFQVMKSFYRAIDRPFVIGSVFTLCGYCWASLQRPERPFSGEVVKFLRTEQVERLYAGFFKR
jgi:GT2 family glycosyltransferase